MFLQRYHVEYMSKCLLCTLLPVEAWEDGMIKDQKHSEHSDGYSFG